MRNIEASLICRLLRTNEADKEKFNNYKIDVSYFHTYNEQYDWMQHFKEKYGKLPGIPAFKRQFPEFPLHKTKEGIEYYCDRMLDREVGIRLKDVSQKVSPLISAGKNVEALEKIRRYVEQVDVVRTSKSINWNIQDRYNEAVRNRAKELKRGTVYTTPYAKLNKAILYMRQQNLVTITGRLGYGKTWVLLYFALWIVKTTKARLLLVSNEMSAAEFLDRLDALDARINWQDFLSGNLSAKHEHRYKRMLARRKTYPGRLHIIDDTTIERKDVSGLVSEIDKFRPDVVFVDGVHQYDYKGSRDEVQKIMNLSRYMKRIAKARKVLLCQTAQQNRTAEGKKKGGGIAGISWGDALAQDSDLVFEVIAPEGRESPIRVLSVIKGRNTGYTEVAFNLRVSPVVSMLEAGGTASAKMDRYYVNVKQVPEKGPKP